MSRIRNPENYVWFDVAYVAQAGADDSWFAYSVRIATLVNWCETNIGSRINRDWCIIQWKGSDPEDALPVTRSYNLQNIRKIGIVPGELATLFRLIFGL